LRSSFLIIFVFKLLDSYPHYKCVPGFGSSKAKPMRIREDPIIDCMRLYTLKLFVTYGLPVGGSPAASAACVRGSTRPPLPATSGRIPFNPVPAKPSE
jgi:hypothetical protein